MWGRAAGQRVSSPDPDDEEPELPQGTDHADRTGSAGRGRCAGPGAGLGGPPALPALGYAEPDVSLLTIGAALLRRRDHRRLGVPHPPDGASATASTWPTTRPSTGWCSARPARSPGRSCVGGYLGYAVAQLGVGDPPPPTRLWRSCLAALAPAR